MTEEDEKVEADSKQSDDSLSPDKVNFREMTNLSALKAIVRSKRVDEIRRMVDEVH